MTMEQENSSNEKKVLLGMSISELQQFVESLGMPKYTASQLNDWIYKKGVSSFNLMSNISKIHREKLDACAQVGMLAPVKSALSKDGTKKYLFQIGNNQYVEAVYIPEKERNTLCVSSQVGCKMNCYFCMTGKQGFNGNLTAAQILSQYYAIAERHSITNIVFMGMGEPLDNLDEVLRAIQVLTDPRGNGMSPKRITLSTVGLTKELDRFMESCQCHLAVSLHFAIPEVRAMYMPLERAMPMQELLAKLRKYDFSGQRRLTFEYIVFSGLNDTNEHMQALYRALKPLHCRLNLIRYHAIPGVNLPGTDEKRLQSICLWLNEKGISTTIRQSRGQDIEAACGMLSTLEEQKAGKQSKQSNQ